MNNTPDAKDHFNSAPPKTTDTKALDHIVSGKPFHITSGEDRGKYIFTNGKDGTGKIGLFKYEIVGGLSTLERSFLKAQSLFNAMTQGEMSLDSLALDGKARSNPMNLIFLEDLVNHDGFQITTGLGCGSYGFEASSGKIEIRDLVPEISGGTVAGFLSHKSDLLAEDLLVSLQKGTFHPGIENSIVFNLAKGKKDHVLPPHRFLGI